MIHDHVLSLIGSTPMVRINRLNPFPGVTVAAKYERTNPGGSIKDRVALAMVEAAEHSGELSTDKTIIEATSGNTGIGLAMVCAVKGYKIMLLMPDSASEERKRIMRAYGAEILLTPGHLGTDGAIEEAYRLAREEPETYVLMDQFNNPASIEAHYRGTGQEIYDQTAGRVTHVVATLGTTGTAMGLARRLKELNPAIRVLAVEPYAGHKIQGLKNMHESYPPGVYDKKALDGILHVEDEQAFAMCRQLAREEGLFVGMSSGAALAGALQVAEEIGQGVVVTIFPDGGERYLSTPLFVPPTRRGLALFNVKTRSKERFSPGSCSVGLFTPGPSPEHPGDLEAWRRIIILDVLTRYLQYNGVACTGTVGLSDLEDQAVERSREMGVSREVFTERFLRETADLAGKLAVTPDIAFIPASRDLESMLDICRKLLGKGRAYEKLRSVYYDVHRDMEYGALGSMDLDKLSLGKTVDLEDYAKENPRDFTLLKRSTLNDLKLGDFLKTQWGSVRPSWYLQMAAAAGVEGTCPSLVLGGQPHQFPHLENLRSLWEHGLGKVPQLWMLAQPVRWGEEPAVPPSCRELLEQLGSPHILRLWLLSTSYRKTLTFSQEGLRMWEKNWRKVQELVGHLASAEQSGGGLAKEISQANYDLKHGLKEAMEDDLALHRFWPVLFDYCRTVNRRMVSKELSGEEAGACLAQLKAADAILAMVDWEGLPVERQDWPEELADLVARRETARSSRDFSSADALRTRISEMGYEIEDTASGPRLHRR